jgi:hypothetical protein
MNTRSDKPKEYFTLLLETSEEEIDYSEIPSTTAADWQDAEVLLPVTAEEFLAIKLFIRRRREQGHEAATQD